jgi:hypothetical protein
VWHGEIEGYVVVVVAEVRAQLAGLYTLVGAQSSEGLRELGT